MITETVKGFADFTGEEALKRREVRRIIEDNFKKYGFEPAETPVIEYEEFVKGENQQDEAVSDIYRLEDKGKRKLALRYEFTFQLKRIASNKKLPYKRYQIGPVFRDEPVSANRFRQFTQCDADIIGSSLKEEAEVLALLNSLLTDLGINSSIFINNRKLINEVLTEQKVKDEDKVSVIKEIDKLDKISKEELIKNLEKYGAEKVLEIFMKPETYFEKYAAYKEIKDLKDLCALYGVSPTFSPTLARGLSYYNGTVFEVKTKEMKETICGGGAFLTNGIQSIGFGAGIERLSNLAKVNYGGTEFLVISIGQDTKAIEIAQNIRKNNKSCSVMFGKISKSMEYANSYKIPYVIMIGEEEVKQKKVKFKNMLTGKESLIKLSEVIEETKK